MRILLLNPPGKRKYLRDYFCSKTTKGDYYYPPVDLVYLSGHFDNDSVYFLDAQIEKLNKYKCLEKIYKINPHEIYSLIGGCSFHEDLHFFRFLKKRLKKVKLFLTGDAFFVPKYLDIIKKSLDFDGIVNNFFTKNIVKIDEIDEIDLLFKIDDKNINPPLPRHELFINPKYKYPFLKNRHFVVVLMDYGCPMGCKFCNIRKIGYKKRSIKNIIKEFEYIKKLDINSIYFSDQNVTSDVKRLKYLLVEMVNRNLKFEGIFFARLDFINEELVKLIKDAGINTLIFGIESYEKNIRITYKNMFLSNRDIKKKVNLCHKFGIKVVLTFMLGITKSESLFKWVFFLNRLNIDFISINIYVNRTKPGGDQSWFSNEFNHLKNLRLRLLQFFLYFYFYILKAKILNFF